MLLSALYVRFRDIQPIWDVFAQILFYGSPIIYPAYDSFRRIASCRSAMCNPIAAIMTQMGHAFIDPSLRSAAVYIGGTVTAADTPGYHRLAFALGLWFFNREAPRISERL